ncbi:MAG: alpha/beta hydrolase [Actinobacteria bacterium]|nr:alpha/beta hydrolase [Actinomycetota bacterium]
MTGGSVCSADGTEIVWRTWGDGPGVVVVHGSLEDGMAWSDVATRLAPRFAVHVMSRRGVGDSGDRPAYAIEREYDDILAVARATRSTRVIGHSFGAICVLGAAAAPELDRVVLYEPPLNIDDRVVPDDALAEVDAAEKRGDVAGVVEVGLRRCVRMPDGLVDAIKGSELWAELVRNGRPWARELRAIRDLPFGVERYRSIAAPVLLPVGETTQVHHRRAAEALSRALPDATIVELPGVGHEAHVLAPDLLAEHLASFLA